MKATRLQGREKLMAEHQEMPVKPNEGHAFIEITQYTDYTQRLNRVEYARRLGFPLAKYRCASSPRPAESTLVVRSGQAPHMPACVGRDLVSGGCNRLSWHNYAICPHRNKAV